MRGRDCPAVPLGPAGKTFEPAPARRLQLVQHTGLGHDLGPVFEVHQIVFVPFAAPDEALGLEGPDDLAVVGLLQRMALHPGPAPVRRPLRAQVDGDTEGMRAQALLSGNGAPQKASGRDQPGLELRPLPHGLAQAAVHGGQRPHGGPAHPHLAPLQGRHAQAPADRGRIRTVQGLQKGIAAPAAGRIAPRRGRPFRVRQIGQVHAGTQRDIHACGIETPGQALFPVQQSRIIIRMGRQLRCRGIEHPPLPFQAQPDPVRPGFHRPDLRVGRTQAQQIDTVLGGQPGELAATFAGSRLRRTAQRQQQQPQQQPAPAGGMPPHTSFHHPSPAGPAASCQGDGLCPT